MFNLSVENSNGKILNLTENPNYAVTHVDGLAPESATINTATVGANDGTKYNSSRVNQRNIVITVHLMGDIESSRIALYTYLKSKQFCRVYYSNNTRSVFIDGYVESMECDFFSRSEFMQISIICPNPYFKNIDETSSRISLSQPLFEFPFSIAAEGIEFGRTTSNDIAIIENNGDITSGMTIELTATAPVTNPSIINADTLESFKLRYSMISGNKIIINTNKGEKSVKVIRYGSTRNIINAIGRNPTWLQLNIGLNRFVIGADSGADALHATIHHRDLFEGV